MGRKLPRHRPTSEDEMPLFNPPSAIGPNRWDEVARSRAKAKSRAPTTGSASGLEPVALGPAPAALGVPPIVPTVNEDAPAALGVSAVPESSTDSYAAIHRRARRVVADERQQAAHLAQMRLRAARRPVPPHDPSRTRVRRRRTEASIAETGARASWDSLLTHEDLWVGKGRPPEVVALRDHHKCGICQLIKSHPVLYKCGHSHCYVCIRLWLEKKWSCPTCVATMSCAPFRHYAEERGLEMEYPELVDESQVLYSFDGLTFPKAKIIYYIEDSD